MWEMAKNSMILFMQGRLFQNSAHVFRQVFFGTIITACILIVVALALTLADFGPQNYVIWIAAGVAGFLGGLLQPYLFKDLKYA